MEDEGDAVVENMVSDGKAWTKMEDEGTAEAEDADDGGDEGRCGGSCTSLVL